MHMTINSKILGRKITFSRPGSSYLFIDLNKQPGTLGNQICKGGNTMGSTITYTGEDQEEFEAICRSWYRSYVRDMRACGLIDA